jgi:hypothetical protein
MRRLLAVGRQTLADREIDVGAAAKVKVLLFG